ncbi:transmembrane 6 superfamily member 2 [Astyanax mexicanus]|uniref:Transmembrane 6 superfamily member 2-like n=2 Tax=Astyanax mexicanus TaxID=7994 RepID=A0A8T2M9V1_ASTMX|nr:transmembrane 6 superfamily member 2 [Astyanax mexicanus]KAG9278682.1 transmembrane 6 superfamily member 2-like [Astyanax mexicanus]
MMALPLEICVFILSLTAPFVLYAANNASSLLTPLDILALEVTVLITVFIMAYLFVRNEKTVDPLYYVFAVFSFTSVSDLTTALEQDGHIRGFVAFYINEGEPYLNAAYCIMMNYWKGVVHFVLLLTIIHCIRKGKQYRSIGLLWAGSMIATQVVFIPGIVIGKHAKSIYPAFWRNILFFILPIWAAVNLFSRQRELPVIPADKVEEEQKKGLLSRPKELLLSLSLLGAMAFAVFRGFVVLECALDICFTYIYQYEPYLKDNVAFSKVTMLVILFYALPMLMACAYGLNTPGCTWMLEWTLILAGAIAQTQWAHIGASVHSRTPFTYRIPKDEWRVVMTLNVLFMAVPLLLALHVYRYPAFFMKTVPPGQADNDKKRK